MYYFLIAVFALLHCPQVMRHVAEPPLRELYFAGPRLKGYGFWNGLPAADICAQITQTSAEVWQKYNQPQCAILLEQNFQAFYVGAYGVLYIVALYYCLTFSQQVYFFHYQYRLLSTMTAPKIKNE